MIDGRYFQDVQRRIKIAAPLFLRIKIVDMKMPPTKETALALENQAKLLYKDGKQKEADEIYKRIRTLNIK